MLFSVLLSQLYTFKESLPVWTSHAIGAVPTVEGHSYPRCRGQAIPSIYPSGCKPQSGSVVTDCLLLVLSNDTLYDFSMKMKKNSFLLMILSACDSHCVVPRKECQC